MIEWFVVSPGQGSALSGFFTAVGAVTGIIIAGKLLAGKVKTLSEALDESKRLLGEHSVAVTSTLKEITEEVNVLKDAVGGVGEQASRIESNVVDAEAIRQPEALEQDEVANWELVKSLWQDARDKLEEAANSDQLDGRRRAAYSRIDRRTYNELIDRMQRDGELSQQRARLFRDALAIWYRYRNGRMGVAAPDIARLRQIRAELLS